VPTRSTPSQVLTGCPGVTSISRVADEAWAAGDSYEAYVGRWSRPVAAEFLGWLDLPAGWRWLDVGCGTGALTEAVLAGCAPASVLGVDASQPFVRDAADRVTDQRAAFVIGDAGRLPVAPRSVDVAVCGLVLNFLPDPVAALDGVCLSVRRVVAAYVWDYADGMQLLHAFWETAVALDPAAADRHEGHRFGLCAPEPLADAFVAAGLRDVEVRPVVVPTVFPSFEDLWSPFLRGTGPAPSYVASLDEPARTALRGALLARLPQDRDGVIRLTARAWAARGAV
jgi:trans-aconitate methyltransferase